jgi:hypothetical protein
MRRMHLILLLISLIVAPFGQVSAWNTTIRFHSPEGYIIDDVFIEYNSSCPAWLVGVFDNGISLQSFAIHANLSGEFRLSDYVYPSGRNATLYLNSSCQVNLSISPEYQPDIFSDTVRGEYRRYLLTKVWFRDLGNGTFGINVPWELIAIYLESDILYENGTYVPKLPLEVEVSWKGREIDRTPALAEPPASYWVDISEEKPSGKVFVKVSGERAKFITKVYGYVIVPYQLYYPAIGGFPFIFPQHRGCRMSVYSPFGNVEVEGEFLWKGSDFTLLKFITSKGETKELYVKDGRVCYGKWARRTCGKYPLPRGALKLTVGFNEGSLWVWSDGTVYFETKLDSLGIKPVEFLGGILSEDIYAVSVYATDRAHEEEDSPLDRISLALSFIAVVISLTALLMSRKKG